MKMNFQKIVLQLSYVFTQANVINLFINVDKLLQIHYINTFHITSTPPSLFCLIH